MAERYKVKRSKRRTGYWAVFDKSEETMYSYSGPHGKDNAKAKVAVLNANDPNRKK